MAKRGRRPLRGAERRERPAALGGEQQHEVKRRTSVSYLHKLDVIEFHAQHNGDTAATVDHFYPTLPKDQRRVKMQLVTSWVKQRDKIQEHCDSGLANQRKVRPRGQGATLPRDIEAQIVAWMNALTRDGIEVTGKMLQDKALELAASCGLDDSVFTASWSWRAGFIRRHFTASHVAPGAPTELEDEAGASSAVATVTTPTTVPVSAPGAIATGNRVVATVSDAESTSVSVSKQVDRRKRQVPSEQTTATAARKHLRVLLPKAPELAVPPQSAEQTTRPKPLSVAQPPPVVQRLTLQDEEEEETVTAPVETLESILHTNGLAQYLPVLQENGFDTPDSLAGIDEYFGDLGVKLGHRKRFKDLSILHAPGMTGVVPFVIVLIDIDAHWDWSQRRTFQASSVCQQWPKGVRVEVQNLFYGRIGAHANATIEYASSRDETPDAPLRCKGEVVFSATLRSLYEAGYAVQGWKPFQHRLMV